MANCCPSQKYSSFDDTPTLWFGSLRREYMMTLNRFVWFKFSWQEGITGNTRTLYLYLLTYICENEAWNPPLLCTVVFSNEISMEKQKNDGMLVYCISLLIRCS